MADVHEWLTRGCLQVITRVRTTPSLPSTARVQKFSVSLFIPDSVVTNGAGDAFVE
jgi:hypothetical protein